MDFTLTPEQQSFRDEVRDWLGRNVPQSWIERLHGEHPEVHIVCAAVDRGLNEHGFIVPGLGDAGDRLYGTK